MRPLQPFLRWAWAAALVPVLVLAVSGCGDDDDGAQRPPLLVVTADELAVQSVPGMEVAETVSQALDAHDADTLTSQFSRGGYVVDPIVPSLRPLVLQWFSLFRDFCSGVVTDDIYVNADGSVFHGDCVGFYDGYVDDPPPVVAYLSELWVEEGLVARMMNRLDAESLARYPIETGQVIGFGTAKGDIIAEMADTASLFASTWVAAWESGEPDQMLALYADDGARIDGFAGLAEDPAATTAWLESFGQSYDQVTVEIETLAASALGPAAAYRLELATAEDSCEMRLVSVWDLDEEGRILREYVYYHPETTTACGWAAAEA